jgi:hypothetical protein
MINRMIVVGTGSVGAAIAKHIRKRYKDLVTWDIKDETIPKDLKFDLMHLCIPFKSWELYLKAVQEILGYFDPTFVIVHSTLVCGIMSKLKVLHPRISWYYSPVRAQEKVMKTEFPQLNFFIAPQPSGLLAYYLAELRLKVVHFPDMESLVMGKLLEVVWFGMNLAFTQQAKLICQAQHLDFNVSYTEYTRLSRIGKDYREKELQYINRPIFVPGYIGGKCVIQDVELMKLMHYGDPRLWDFICETNEYFRGEKKHDK